MPTLIPDDYADIVPLMQADDKAILAHLRSYDLLWEAYPADTIPLSDEGIAAAKAYPIQGVLKYHGMSDWDWRIAYLPSISVNNDAAYSLTLVEFSHDLKEDVATINGELATGRDLERVQHTLDFVRRLAGMTTPARVVSRNVTKAERVGKGLGTSASASAALAMAAIAAVFGDELANNRRFLTCVSRLLAGSGCRSAAGGISLWLSYPGAAHEDSFAVQLDNNNQLEDLSLITIPIDSRIGLKTELAHKDAPHSPLYKHWMLDRRDITLECIDAIQQGDWRTVGQMAEQDSIILHGVTMSGSRENKIFGWEPENIYLFRMCNELRSAGIPVYFSTDTGPTVVLFTHKQYEADVVAAVHALKMGFEVVCGKLGGPSVLVDPLVAAQQLA